MPFVIEILYAKDPRDTKAYTDDPIHHLLTQTTEHWYTMGGSVLSSTVRGIRTLDLEVHRHRAKFVIEFPNRRQAHAWLVQFRFNDGNFSEKNYMEYTDVVSGSYPESRRVIGYEWDGSCRIGPYVDFRSLDADGYPASFNLLYDERVDG